MNLCFQGNPPSNNTRSPRIRPSSVEIDIPAISVPNSSPSRSPNTPLSTALSAIWLSNSSRSYRSFRGQTKGRSGSDPCEGTRRSRVCINLFRRQYFNIFGGGEKLEVDLVGAVGQDDREYAGGLGEEGSASGGVA